MSEVIVMKIQNATPDEELNDPVDVGGSSTN